eukprot:TRINITY_DN57794_c0_g1_i1.p1 TRINITY_DN57794_c0_g1~~TRINITY_DN57794_c0_g1_i1.p1  ORF type:complete len:325 (-),score=62.66 TRINITY_DN57794_c0_g1_i1:49-1023(-)
MAGLASDVEPIPKDLRSRPRPRPARLDLKVLNQWPTFSIEDEAIAAAREMVVSRPKTRLIRVVTWNVWFDSLQQYLRANALMKEVLREVPDVICLQEVLPGFLESLRKSEALRAAYHISPFEIAGYGSVMLVRSDWEVQFSDKEMPSQMGRRLLMADIRGPWDRQFLTVATVHLESLNNQALRRQQLAYAADTLAERPCAIFCGDFNFDDRQLFGDWDLGKDFTRPPDELENEVLKEILPDFLDVWPAVSKFQPDNRAEPEGFTFDGFLNPQCVPNPLERMRYDRIMVRNLRPLEAKLLGKASINNWGLCASDHFGVIADLGID